MVGSGYREQKKLLEEKLEGIQVSAAAARADIEGAEKEVASVRQRLIAEGTGQAGTDLQVCCSLPLSYSVLCC